MYSFFQLFSFVLLQVFSSSSLRTHDIFSKLEQAFCCSLLTPLPEVREKFLNLYLTGSNLISHPIFPEEEEEKVQGDDDESSEVNQDDKKNDGGKQPVKVKEEAGDDDAGDDGEDKPVEGGNSSLFVRLLFLFVSSSWDEMHFKDNFWLPLFFDVRCYSARRVLLQYRLIDLCFRT